VINTLIEQRKQAVRKGFFICAFVLLLGLSSLWAQKFEITPFAGYQFGGNVSARDADLSIKDSTAFGLTVDIYVRPNIYLELTYIHQDTDVDINDYLTVKRFMLDTVVQYFQIGGLIETQSGSLRPFGIFTAGATLFNPKEAGISSAWRLSFTIGGGAKIFFSEHLGIRLQGQLLFPYITGGGGFFCGLPGGCYITLEGNLMVQANVTAGVILAF
jgi:hypothetical protein